MDYVFQDAVRFNGDISTWDVSNVYDFSGMFIDCSEFTGDLSLWNTGNALVMSSMFYQATKFHGQGLAKWSVSNVFYFDYMFADAVSLTEDLSSWDVSSVQSMKYMVRIFLIFP